MINTKFSLTNVWMSLLLISSTTLLTASERFELKHPSVNDEDISITSVIYEEDKTIVNLEFELSGDAYDIGIYAKDSKSAFVITSLDHTKRYKLLEIDGIAILPKMDKMINKGDGVKFSLTFEKMPLREFDMFEGYVHNSEYEFWHFEDVKVGDVKKKKEEGTLPLAKLTDENFLDVVKQDDKLVAVKFWASWCGACKTMKPIYQEAAKSMNDKVAYTTMNTEGSDVIPSYLNIEYLPTTILFKNGLEVSRAEGSLERIEILEWIRSNL